MVLLVPANSMLLLLVGSCTMWPLPTSASILDGTVPSYALLWLVQKEDGAEAPVKKNSKSKNSTARIMIQACMHAQKNS